MLKNLAVSLLILLLITLSVGTGIASPLNRLAISQAWAPFESVAGRITQVSVASNGEKGNGSSHSPSISGNGRYVVFVSSSTNLVADGYEAGGLFIHDLQNRTTRSVAPPDGGYNPSISSDGRYVAFDSSSRHLAENDTNGQPDIFVWDTQQKTTRLVSVASNGTIGEYGSSGGRIWSDGQHVAFLSVSTNLINDDTNTVSDIFVHDLPSGITERVSVASNGAQGNNKSYRPAISENGNYVAFISDATNLVNNDTNGYSDVFLRNRKTGITTRISANPAGQQANHHSEWVGISADGRYVIFISLAGNLVAGDTNGAFDTFVYDQELNTLKRVSYDIDGSQLANGGGGTSISSDGNLVAYTAYKRTYFGILIHNLATKEIRLVSSTSDGLPASCCSSLGFMSDDGRFVTFYSDSPDYGNLESQQNVFVNDLGDGGFCEIPLAARSNNTADSDGDGLLDPWETCGYDVNGDNVVDIDLPALGADPNRKDIFVEIDYMETVAHSHRPPVGALEDVVTVFATKGISLHLSIDEAVPEIEPVSFYTGSVQTPPAGSFNDLKLGNPVNPCGVNVNDGHFGSIPDRSSPNCINIIAARRDVFRYAIFAHNHAHWIGSSGIAELPGNDFLVTLGGWSNFQHQGGQRNVVAGTFMHELGHTLDLEHGGSHAEAHFNCKPNYLSVMNYSFQLANLDPARPLDYSNQALPALNEMAGLDESVGIQGPVGRYTIYGLNGVVKRASANGPINWNGIGTSNDKNVTADINYLNVIPSCPMDGLTLFNGHDDWQNLVFNFRTSPDFADGAPRTTPLVEHELTYEEALKMAEAIDFDEDGYSNAKDNCPAIHNPDQIDTDNNGIGDACQLDTDDDGYTDAIDNCPMVYNPPQVDTNGDGVGDACEMKRKDLYLPIITK